MTTLDDLLLVLLREAWEKTKIKNRNHPRQIQAARKVWEDYFPMEPGPDGKPEFLAAYTSLSKAWVEQFARNLHRSGSYEELTEVLKDSNDVARGLVVGDEVLGGLRRTKVSEASRREIVDRSVHGVLEAHHVVEKVYLKHFKRLRKAYDNDQKKMPCIALPQAEHRGNASQIAGLVGKQLPQNALKASRRSLSTFLEHRIVLKGEIPKNADPSKIALIIDSSTTEEQLLAALHKVYKDYDQEAGVDIYEKVVKQQLLGVQAKLDALPTP